MTKIAIAGSTPLSVAYVLAEKIADTEHELIIVDSSEESYLALPKTPYDVYSPFEAYLPLLTFGYGLTARGRNDGTEGAPPKNPPKVIPKGCKEFEIEGVKIVALNQKNAERKYLKMYQRRSI